jgi:hypothetical protein
MLAPAFQLINESGFLRVSLRSIKITLPGAALGSVWPTAAWQLKPMAAESGSRMALAAAAAASFLLYPYSLGYPLYKDSPSMTTLNSTVYIPQDVVFQQLNGEAMAQSHHRPNL